MVLRNNFDFVLFIVNIEQILNADITVVSIRLTMAAIKR